MAIIPLADQAQVLAASNPQAVGSTANADIGQEASAQLGKAIMVLGNELDKTTRVAHDKTKSFQAQTAAEMYEQDLSLYSQNQLFKDAGSDVTGTQAVQKLREYGDTRRKAMIEEYGFQGEQAAQFEMLARRNDSKFVPKVMVDSAKVATEAHDTHRNILISTMASSVNQGLYSPEEGLVRVAELVQNDPDTPAYAKEIVTKNSQAMMVKSLYEKKRFEQDFKGAAEVLDSNRTLFEADYIIKEKNALLEDNSKTENMKWTTTQRKEREDATRKAEAQQAVATFRFQEIQSAGTNSAKLALARQKIQLSEVSGELSHEMAATLLKADPAGRKELDDFESAQALQRAFRTQDFTGELQKLYGKTARGEISFPAYMNLTETLGKYAQFKKDKRADRKFDLFRDAFKAGADYLKSVGKDPNDIQNKKAQANYMDYLQEVQQQLLKSNNVDFKQILEEKSKSWGADYNLPAPKSSNAAQSGYRSADEVTSEIVRQTAIFQKNLKNLTTDQRNSSKLEIQRLEQLRDAKKAEEQRTGGSNGSENNRAASKPGRF